jgi:hypothetical protein
VYNLVYHAGLIYEDLVYVAGGDIFGDEIERLDTYEERERNY